MSFPGKKGQDWSISLCLIFHALGNSKHLSFEIGIFGSVAKTSGGWSSESAGPIFSVRYVWRINAGAPAAPCLIQECVRN